MSEDRWMGEQPLGLDATLSDAAPCGECGGRRRVIVGHRTPSGGIGPTMRSCPTCVIPPASTDREAGR